MDFYLCSGAMTANTPIGARHLYLMDLSGENLPNLKSTIEERYPDVTVRTQTLTCPMALRSHILAGHCHSSRRCRRQSDLGCLPPGTQRARQTRYFLCKRACSRSHSLIPCNRFSSTQAGVASSRTLEETSGEMFTNVMRINALS